MTLPKFDIAIVGSGIAGLFYAIRCASFARVLIITKDKIGESNTVYAQGGISAVMDANDSVENHIADIIARKNFAPVEWKLLNTINPGEKMTPGGADFTGKHRFDELFETVCLASDFPRKHTAYKLLASSCLLYTSPSTRDS